MNKVIFAFAAGALVTCNPTHGQSFVNWESPHVSPVDLTPDGSLLLAVNTADNRLEVFTVTGGGLTAFGSIPVGLDPVSVRARSNTEAWVVNHVSDTVSVVDLVAMNVIATLYPGDEPADVVFAGAPQRAFVTVSQLNQVLVYDPANLAAPPIVLDIVGEDPRALATDGTTVYAAIFESGNRTTVIGQVAASSNLNPYPGNENPPPNDGVNFSPPIAGDLPVPPPVAMIVRKEGSNMWLDDNGADWSAAVGWDLHDHDVAIIDANSLAISYATGLMNANMALGVHPNGGVTVVGVEAINELRFEPVLTGIFVRVMGASVTGPGAGTVTDLNPHLDYSSGTVSQAIRDQSLGDPRGVAWRDASRGFITGMGSNNVAVVDGSLTRIGLVEVGEGPTGAVYDAFNDRVYVLNKFEGSISIVDAGTLAESRIVFYDPTPAVIKDGRPFLYDTHRTSGLGQASCASCHFDGRMDQLAWDLGDPQGAVKPFNQVCNFGLIGGCEDWHPMKGPMTTQSLIGIIQTGPLHWRADRENLAAFNGAFVGLLGDDAMLTPTEMAQYTAFVTTLTYPPNPFRELDGSLPTSVPSQNGNPQIGQSAFSTAGLDGVECVTCHALPTGTNGQLTSGNLLQEPQSMKIPQLRNMYEKTGFESTTGPNNRGFGFTHDGAVNTMFDFLNFPGFQFQNDQERRDVAAFMMCFSTDTHAGVGAQTTIPASEGAAQPATVADLIAVAASGNAGLVAKGIVAGVQRGYYRLGSGDFQSDRAAEVLDQQTMLALAGVGEELTFTLVPTLSGQRIGVDRDQDGFFDRDELDAGSNPADPGSTPDNVVPGDLDGDGMVGITDFLQLLALWGPCGNCDNCPADLDGDCDVGITDFLQLLANWG